MKEFDEVLKELKNKIYHPIYFLMGDESYYIDFITDFIAKHILNETEKTFNQLILYGKDTDIATVINSAQISYDVKLPGCNSQRSSRTQEN